MTETHPTTDTNPTDPQAITSREQEAAFLLQAEISRALRTEIGLLPDIANEWAARVTRSLRNQLGAQSVYIPAPSKAERDAAVYREHDGTNTAAVMKRHNISRTRLYEIVEEQRKQRAASGPVRAGFCVSQ